MKKYPKLVIFDNDGVVVDSEGLIKQSLKTAVATYGIELSISWAIGNVQGRKPADTFQTIIDHYSVPFNIDDAIELYVAEAARLFEISLKPMAHIASVLQELQKQGVAFCIATGGGLPQTYNKMVITGLEAFFPKEHIFSSSQVTHSKPAPDLFLFAAKNMGFEPQDCVVIEDSHLGIQGANAANMRAIGFTGGEHGALFEEDYAALLKNAGADIVIDSHNDLLKAIAQ
jgi:HAD superfamily hydrolase (TIGR01509 family)